MYRRATFFSAPLCLLACVVGGCATAPLTPAVSPKDARGVITPEDFRSSAEYKGLYTQTMVRCQAASEQMRGATAKSSKIEMTIAAAGVVAGSVIVPGLAAASNISKVAVAAFGGVAGATNGLQYAWNQKGQGAAARANTYQRFVNGFITHMEAVDKAKAWGEARTALDAVDRYCVITPPAPIIENEAEHKGSGSGGASSAEASVLKAAIDALNLAKADLAEKATLAQAEAEKAKEASKLAAAETDKVKKREAALEAATAAEAARKASADAQAQRELVQQAQGTVTAAAAQKAAADAKDTLQKLEEAATAQKEAQQSAGDAAKAAGVPAP